MTTALPLRFGSGDGQEYVSYFPVHTSSWTVKTTKFIPVTGNTDYYPDDDHRNVTQNVIATASGQLSTSPEILHNSTTATNEITFNNNGNEYGSNLVLIVGVTCGVMGLLLGILFTAAIFLYRTRLRPRRELNRSRLSSVLEKNPPEATFEPLDMSLTLPRYDRSQSAMDYYQQQTLREARFDNTSAEEDLGHLETDSYRNFEMLPVSTLPKHRSKFGTFPSGRNRPSNHYKMNACFMLGGETSDPNSFNDQTDASENIPTTAAARHAHNETAEAKKSPVSVSARESFSSGLGTGTESDVFPCENKPIYLPVSSSINESLVIYSDQQQSGDQQSCTDRESNRSRSHSVLSVVTEGGQRRKSRSTIISQRKRALNTSTDATSSSESSNTDPHFVSFQLKSVTPTPISDRLTYLNSGNQFSNKRDCSEEDKKCEISMTNLAQEKSIPMNKVEGHGNNELVSTYFDLHFPSSSLTSNKPNTEVVKTNTDGIESSNSTIVAINDKYDDTIDL